MLMIFAKSNTYRALHASYEELGAFGTSATVVLPNYKNVLHQYPVTTGEFAISTNAEGHVNTLYREFEKTVGQLHEEFGKESLSKTVQSLADQEVGRMGADHSRHRAPACQGRAKSAMRGTCDSSRFIGKSAATAMDSFESPGSTTSRPCAAVGRQRRRHLRQQPGHGSPRRHPPTATRATAEVAGHRLHDKPPLQAPSSLKNGEINGLPGGFTFVDMTGPQGP